MKNSLSLFSVGAFGLISAILVVGLVLGSCVIPFATQDKVSFTVTDKERIVEKNGDAVSSKYLVFTDVEVFENTDCFVLFKFDSSDIQGELKVGERYSAKVYGWRLPFFSAYRNIISVNKM